jgi:hypothetical protein
LYNQLYEGDGIMSANAYRILEITKNMPSRRIDEGIPMSKSLGDGEVGMTIEEFDEAIKYIQQKELLKVLPITEKQKIIMIKVLDKYQCGKSSLI